MIEEIIMNKYSLFGKFLFGENDIFSFSRDYNLLCVFNKNYKISKVDFLPGENYFSKNLISEVIEWKDKLIFVPKNITNLYIKDGNEFRLIDLSEVVENGLNNKFECAFLVDDYLYLFGHWASQIVEINLAEERVEYNYRIPDEYVLMKEKKQDAFFSNYYYENNKVFLPFLSAGYIAILDLKTKNVEWKKVRGANSGFSSIIGVSDERYIMPCRGNGVYVLDKTFEIKDYLFENIDFTSALGMCLKGDNVLIPCYRDGVYSININSNKCDKNEGIMCWGMSCDKEDYYVTSNEGLILLSGNEKRTLSLDFSGINDLINQNEKRDIFHNEDIIFENDLFSIDNFIYNI